MNARATGCWWALVLAAAFGLTMGSGRAERTQGNALARVDHLVYATPNVNASVDALAKQLGVRATSGGQHPGRGTRNALLALGRTTYLEIIGPDPEQPKPAAPRVFGIDSLRQAKLVTWAAKASDLSRIARDAAKHGIHLGEIRPGSRRRPDGVLLTWQFTDPLTVIGDGIVPFFIDWGETPHPAQTAASGATLVHLRAEHPEPERVQKTLTDLGLELRVTRGPSPLLVATIDCPRGRVELR